MKSGQQVPGAIAGADKILLMEAKDQQMDAKMRDTKKWRLTEKQTSSMEPSMQTELTLYPAGRRRERGRLSEAHGLQQGFSTSAFLTFAARCFLHCGAV